jgi:hypothetical protein
MKPVNLNAALPNDADFTALTNTYKALCGDMIKFVSPHILLYKNIHKPG